jgi:hypothetical protein
VFIDETGFLLSPLVRRTWAPCGQTPVVRPRTRHQRRVSAIGGLASSTLITLVFVPVVYSIFERKAAGGATAAELGAAAAGPGAAGKA